MISIFLIDPGPYPQYDEQTWWLLPWRGTAIPMGRRLGEWAWVGRTK